MKTPNHICKNPRCSKGSDGTRKQYYACDYCDRIESWRSVACCLECYQEYIAMVLGIRSKDKLTPDRIDKTDAEMAELYNQDIDKVRANTLNDLSEYGKEIEEYGLSRAIDNINEELDIIPRSGKGKK